MTEAEQKVRDELVAWGEFNERTHLDVSLARYREIVAARAAGEPVGPMTIVMSEEPHLE